MLHDVSSSMQQEVEPRTLAHTVLVGSHAQPSCPRRVVGVARVRWPHRSRHANLTATTAPSNGPCVDEVIASDTSGSQVMAVDGDTLFWVTGDGHLFRHDGSGTTQLTGDYFYAQSIAVDATNVYGAAEDGHGNIIAVPRLGGSVTKLYDATATAIVVRDDTLFYITDDAGGSVVALSPAAAATSRTTLADDLQPLYFAVDDTNVYVSTPLGILRASRALSSAQQTAVQLAPTGNGGPVAVYGGTVYFVDNDSASGMGPTFSVPAVGGPVTLVSSIAGEIGTDLAVDGSGVYQAVNVADDVSSIQLTPLAGSTCSMFFDESEIDASAIISAVRVTDDAVYFTILPSSEYDNPPEPVVRKKCK